MQTTIACNRYPRAKDLDMAKQVSTVSGGGKSYQERCSLCKERLRGAHSHPEQWQGELQQFLLRYADIPDPLHV